MVRGPWISPQRVGFVSVDSLRGFRNHGAQPWSEERTCSAHRRRSRTPATAAEMDLAQREQLCFARSEAASFQAGWVALAVSGAGVLAGNAFSPRAWKSTSK